MDAFLADLHPDLLLPYEDLAPPGLFTSVLHQLWGVVRGGSALEEGRSVVSALEEVEVDEERSVEEEEVEVEEERSVEEVPIGSLDPSAKPWCPASTTALDVTPAQRMTATTLDIQLVDYDEDVREGGKEAEHCWQFDFGDGLGGDKFGIGKGADSRTDDDTLTSMASEETLRCRGACIGRHSFLEEHEVGSLVMNPGPPFAVGTVIKCDIGDHGHQRAFVLESDHPCYKLRLEDGTTVSASTYNDWLSPGYATWEGNPNGFAQEWDNPFVKARAEVKPAKLGSYGIHGDAQRELFLKVEEAKEFAKAVKADDAEIPLFLWNNRIKAPGVTKERRDAALDSFRKLGFVWFMRGLRRDCTRFMRETHGEDWCSMPRRHPGGGNALTELGCNQQAIISMLWHASHTTWFEFHAGSRLVHFRFSIRYRQMARDGVPVFFESPGPTMKGRQPIIADAGVRARTREKIGKVMKRRYLLTTDLPIKSFIKFFAVAKGEDDVRLVYDATANKLNKCVWVPSFWLPTIDSLVRACDVDTWMTDRDIGDMFLNFQLHASVIPFTGVDLASLYNDLDEVGPRWAVWDRNLMGFAASPYNSIRMALVAEEICKGD